MATYAQLQKQIEKLQAEADRLRRQEVADVVARIKEAIAVYDIGQEELFGGRQAAKKAPRGAGKAATSSGVAMYRDPASGKTWTGRGKPPLWIAGAADRTPFLINRPAGANGAAPARSANGLSAGASAKGTVGVPMYRDPASGKTWTGRGKPPLWIAGVADRTPFLITGAPAANGAVQEQAKAAPSGRGGRRGAAKKSRRTLKAKMARAAGRRGRAQANDAGTAQAEGNTGVAES